MCRKIITLCEVIIKSRALIDTAVVQIMIIKSSTRASISLRPENANYLYYTRNIFIRSYYAASRAIDDWSIE